MMKPSIVDDGVIMDFRKLVNRMVVSPELLGDELVLYVNMSTLERLRTSRPSAGGTGHSADELTRTPMGQPDA